MKSREEEVLRCCEKKTEKDSLTSRTSTRDNALEVLSLVNAWSTFQVSSQPRLALSLGL